MAEMNDEEARAALEASQKLYYRIGEVSKLTGVKAHVLRYWETEFRWMAPPKSRSKQRLYRKRDIEFVWLLKRLLWDERYTIAGARQRIQDLGVDDALALLRQGDSSDGISAGVSEMDAASVSAGVSTGVSSGSSSDPSSVDGIDRGSSRRVQRGRHAQNSPDSAPLPEERRAEWLALGAALGDLHTELSSLRGALQEGL